MADSGSTLKILENSGGVLIAIDEEAHSMSHYGPVRRLDEPSNHGWVDTLDNPDAAERIPEAAGSAGLRAVLKAANAVDSPFVTVACDCNPFKYDAPKGTERFTDYVGGYSVVARRDPERATRERAISIAYWIAEGLFDEPTPTFSFRYEFVIEGLKYFYGHTGCWAVMLKALGDGHDPATALESFDAAQFKIARSINRWPTLPKPAQDQP